VILLRNPIQILSSVGLTTASSSTEQYQWSEKLAATLDETGFVELVQIWSHFNSLVCPLRMLAVHSSQGRASRRSSLMLGAFLKTPRYVLLSCF
jgi:hypothetical protein